MATRDLYLNQEDSANKIAQVVLSPTAAKGTLSFNASGVPVVNAAPAAITDCPTSSVTPSVAYVQAEATQIVTDLNAAITKLNALLAAARTANQIQ